MSERQLVNQITQISIRSFRPKRDQSTARGTVNITGHPQSARTRASARPLQCPLGPTVFNEPFSCSGFSRQIRAQVDGLGRTKRLMKAYYLEPLPISNCYFGFSRVAWRWRDPASRALKSPVYHSIDGEILDTDAVLPLCSIQLDWVSLNRLYRWLGMQNILSDSLFPTLTAIAHP